MSEFLDEAIDETIGRSSKKWALLLLAFVAGAASVVWVRLRISAHGERPDPGGPDSAPRGDGGTE